MTMPVLAACAFGVMAAILHVVSIAAVMHRIRRPEVEPSEAGTAKGVSIVRPVCGLENFSEETLSSAFRLEYPNYEILFCVAQPTDPVLPLVRSLIELHPEVPARLLIGNERVSVNPKLNNIVKGWLAASHPWIVGVVPTNYPANTGVPPAWAGLQDTRFAEVSQRVPKPLHNRIAGGTAHSTSAVGQTRSSGDAGSMSDLPESGLARVVEICRKKNLTPDHARKAAPNVSKSQISQLFFAIIGQPPSASDRKACRPGTVLRSL